MIPVFVLPRTPGATDAVAWGIIDTRTGPFVTIGHEFYRTLSTNKFAERKNKFRVKVYAPRSRNRMSRDVEMTWYPTLEAARAGAERKAKLWTTYFDLLGRPGTERVS